MLWVSSSATGHICGLCWVQMSYTLLLVSHFIGLRCSKPLVLERSLLCDSGRTVAVATRKSFSLSVEFLKASAPKKGEEGHPRIRWLFLNKYCLFPCQWMETRCWIVLGEELRWIYKCTSLDTNVCFPSFFNPHLKICLLLLLLILERGRERAKHPLVASTHLNWGSNQKPRIKAKPPGMCSNPQSSGVRTTLLPTEPLQQGPKSCLPITSQTHCPRGSSVFNTALWRIPLQCE